jgi:ABC-type nitrate/sulfonate/bicarbonate transport system substrate-binding protein
MGQECDLSKTAAPELLVLGFKAFDLHELLLHFVAERLGHYQREGLAVRLRDITFTPEEKLEAHVFSVACGSTLLGRVPGARRKVVFVATEHPMFWIHARAGTTNLERLRGTRIATYPPASPPWLMHRAILGRHGLNPDQDVQLEAARDDVARLGLLRSGNVEAAVLSSAVPPAKAQSLGLATVAFFGDEIRIPTTGLAVSEEIIREQPALVRRLVAALRSSLRSVHESPGDVLPALELLLDGGKEIAEKTYEIVRACFTKSGRASADARKTAIELVNGQNPPARIKEEDVYDDSFLTR